MARFGQVLTAMVTPFDADEQLDVDASVKLAKWLVEQGNEGLVVAGTTGESATLSIDEKLTLFEAVADAVTVPVIAGTTGSNTRQDIGLTGEAEKLGMSQSRNIAARLRVVVSELRSVVVHADLSQQ